MAAAADKWTRIGIAFRSGAPPTEICAQHGVRLRELIARAQAEGWKHGSDKKGDVPADQVPEEPATAEAHKHLPATPEQLSAAPPPGSRREDTAADVERRQKRRIRTLQDRLDLLFAEFDKQLGVAQLFFDLTHMQALAAKRDREAFDGFKMWVAVTDKLTQQMTKAAQTDHLLTAAERGIFGLEADKDGGGNKSMEETYQELLEQIRTPLPTRELPSNVFAFERKIARVDAPQD